MQIKFEESNLRQVDIWLYSTSDTSIEFIDFSKNSLFWESKKKKQFKIQFSRLLRRRIFEPVGMDTKVVYPPVFLGEKSIKVTKF